MNDEEDLPVRATLLAALASAAMFCCLLACGAVLSSSVASCSAAAVPVEKAIVRTVIDVSIAECIARNPGLDEPALRAICKYDIVLGPVVEKILTAQREGLSSRGIDIVTVTMSRPDGGAAVYRHLAGDGG